MRFERVLSLVAMTSLWFAWLVPNHYQPWYSFYNETAAFTALFLLAAVLMRPGHAAPLPNVSLVIVAVAAIPWIQWSLGLLAFAGDAWVSTLYVFGFAVAVDLGSRWSGQNRSGAATALATTTLAGALISSVVAWLQAAGIAEGFLWIVGMPPGGQPVGNLGHWNLLANLIGTATVCLLMLFEKERFTAVTASVFLGVLLAGLGATQSRTALLFGPIILISVLIARRRGVVYRTPNWVMVASTAAHWALTAAMPFIQAQLLLNASDSLAVRGVSTPRWQMWTMLLDAASHAPWFGYGWLQVGAAELAVVNRYPPINELWLQGHDVFLELILWCGYPLGLALATALLGWFASRALRVRTLESITGMTIVALLGAHSLFEFPFQYAYFLIPAGLWIGQIEQATGTRSGILSFWSPVLAASTLAIAAGIAWNYMAVEEDFQLVRFQGKGIGAISAVDMTPDAPFLTGLTSFLHASRAIPSRGMTRAELDSLEAVVKRYPYPAGLARSARALALNGRLVEARERFISIRQMFGDGTYISLRRDLRQRAEAGEGAELAALDRSLP